MMRYPLVVGNWKLFGNQRVIYSLIMNIRKQLGCISGCTVAVAPPEIYLYMTKHIIDDVNIMLCAQNVDTNLSGAFTGETSAQMLKDTGVKYVIIGHSERRLYHNESDVLIAKKFAVLKRQDLIPILCIGETQIEYDTGKTKDVCVRQIDAILKNQGVSAFKNTVIAYEPVWAIGTGKSATPDQVQEIHKFIRNYIASIDKQIANCIIIQYGGSVNVTNAASLFAQPDIDGLLIGSSSLNASDFSTIVKIASTTKTCSK